MKNVVNSDILKYSEKMLVQRERKDNSEFNINDEKEVKIVSHTSKRSVM